MSTFRIESKSIFLTYPQCQTSLSSFQKKINEFFGENLEKGVISQESHKDLGLHLHAAISLKERFRSRDPKVFDCLVDPPKHPNIQTRFSGGILKAFLYVMKEGNFMSLGQAFNLSAFIEAAEKKKSTKTALILKDIKEGQTLDDLVEDHSEYLLTNLRKVKEYMEFLSLRERRLAFAEAQTLKVHVRPANNCFTSWNQEIASWLKLNLREKRAHRQKQLWICARPGMGKTSLIMMLEKEFKLSVYYWPKEEVWWDAYSDGAYDLIVLDEFHSQKTITQLNPILSGDPTPLSRRCSAPLTKRDNLPVIIMSNYLPEECFSKVAANAPSKLEPLLDRLTIVKVEGPIRIVKDDYFTSDAEDLPDFENPPPSTEPCSPWQPSPELPEFPGSFSSPLGDDLEGAEAAISDFAEKHFQMLNDPDYFNNMGRNRLLKATDNLIN